MSKKCCFWWCFRSKDDKNDNGNICKTVATYPERAISISDLSCEIVRVSDVATVAQSSAYKDDICAGSSDSCVDEPI